MQDPETIAQGTMEVPLAASTSIATHRPGVTICSLSQSVGWTVAQGRFQAARPWGKENAV